MAYDPQCLELAKRWLPATVPVEMPAQLAQHIQDAITDWLGEHAQECVRVWPIGMEE